MGREISKLVLLGVPDENAFLIRRMIPLWKSMGINSVFSPSPDFFPECHHAFLHIDETIVSRPFLQAARAYPSCINRQLTDISKRRFSLQLLRRDDSYAGPVIVKTNANSYGKPEGAFYHAYKQKHPLLAGIRRHLFREKKMRSRATFPGNIYPIFNSSVLVPPLYWKDDRYIVEKFITEKKNDLYVLRMAFVLGDRHVNYVTTSRNPVVKNGAFEDMWQEPIPVEILEFQKKFHVDYAKIDYVMHNGKCIIFDVNKTPGSPASLDKEDDAMSRILAPGLLSCFN